jgi:hypothetical protein
MRWWLLLFSSLGLVACGNSGSELLPPDGGDAKTESTTLDASADAPVDVTMENQPTPDGGFAPAAHAPFPQIPYQDGGIILAPQLVTVTFPGDPMTSELVSFGSSVESSSWWSTVTKGYCEGPSGPCIGPGGAATSVVYPSAPASSYTDTTQGGPSTLQTWLAGALTSGDLPAPASGAISNTLYLLYFPATTTITLDGTGGCENYDGYHAAMTYGGQQVAYAVISECPGQGMGVPAITTLQGTTITASHEIIEASTDPSDISTGYYLNLDDPNNFGWNDIEGGEVADVCVDVFGFDQDEWPEGDFTVQRIWSNTQAAAGGDPCAPLTTDYVYFNAAPTESFFVMDVGSTLTVDIDAFSVAPRADWTLTVEDWSLYPKNPYLSFSIVGGTVDKNLGDIIQVNNGSKIQVKMTLESDPGDNPNGEADGAILSFTGQFKGAPAHYWPFAVMSPADAEDAGIDAAVSTGGKKPRRTRVTQPRRAAYPELVPGLIPGLTRRPGRGR